ncbi:MAG: hypothetical protein KF831_12215 [Acidobacteria bacterium]|nr:hypothetical protein [Acidobacteriota bacterium]
MKRFMQKAGISLALVTLFAASLFGQKMTAEQIIAKHLDSIGTAEARGAIKDMVARGNVAYTALRSGGAGGDGAFVIASEGDKSLLGMTFRTPDYPGETFIFDGNKTKIAFAVSNTRSFLGDYLFKYDNIVKEGLLGGTLIRGWRMHNATGTNARIRTSGKKKIEGVETLVLEYNPRRGSDVTIKLYFDATTFRHVRTEYNAIIPAQQGPTVDTSSQRRETRETLVEDFGDYKEVNGLTLPHSYKMYLRLDSERGTREYEFKSTFREFFFNQGLDPNSFSVN